MAAYLQFDEVCKFFPGVKALNGVSFDAHAGQVHGLLGENGAGKSNLLKILGGQYKPDGGRLLVSGLEQRFTSAKDAIKAGIAVIHQELQYVPELTVAENVLLGRMPTRFGLLDKPKARQMVADKLAAIGVELDPDARLADLSIAQLQMACAPGCSCVTGRKRRWPMTLSRACASRPRTGSRKSACYRAATSKK